MSISRLIFFNIYILFIYSALEELLSHEEIFVFYKNQPYV